MQRKIISSKVAIRKLQASVETDLAGVFQHGALQADTALKHVEDIVERAMVLINDSKQKEHIYSEAGDLITNVSKHLEAAREGLDIITYTSSKLDIKNVKSRIPKEIRDNVDKIIKRHV